MKKTIPYKDTFLTIDNYKEPLKEIEGGYGYYGCLLSTLDGTKVLCGICGGLYGELQAHVRMKHKLTPPQYRERFGLSSQTALVSEYERERRKKRTGDWAKKWRERINKMTPWERDMFYCKMREGRARGTKHLSLEIKNKRGTCPDQLLAKILEARDYFNRTPSLAEFMEFTDGQRYKHLIFATFGSWSAALKILELTPKRRQALQKKKHYYSDEELLEYIKLFYEETGRVPTASDCKRGFLPYYEAYRRFGGMPRAREMAGIYE